MEPDSEAVRPEEPSEPEGGDHADVGRLVKGEIPAGGGQAVEPSEWFTLLDWGGATVDLPAGTSTFETLHAKPGRDT